MTCVFEIDAIVDEGSFAKVFYNLTTVNDLGEVVPITAVDKLEYKLTDGIKTLIDWTEIIAPELPAGNIKILGSNNLVSDQTDRYFTLHANYNSGVDDSFKTSRYSLKDSPNT